MIDTSSNTLDILKEKETKMNPITATMAKTMMHDIDVRLDQKSHYTTDVMPKGTIYHNVTENETQTIVYPTYKH